jgi:hypothetical protein
MVAWRRRNSPGEAGSVSGAYDAFGSTAVTLYGAIIVGLLRSGRWSARRAYRMITLIGGPVLPR